MNRPAEPDPGAPQAGIPHPLRQELWNALTHGLGAAAALAGGAVLITLAAIWGDAWQLAGAIVFGVALLLLYTASTLYHAIQHPVAKGRLKVFDHCAIYLLIAGTYTPFTLVSLRGPWGWSLLAVVWSMAIIGIVLELRRVRNRIAAALLYLGMGWVGIIAIKPMIASIPPGGLWLLLGGGLCYTLGVPFYLWKRLPYNHALWHLFVLAGSVLQFFSVLLYVLPEN